MKEIIKGTVPVNGGSDECCSIAESMMEEIQLITIHEKKDLSGSRRHKGSIKRMLMRQIRQAKKLTVA